MYSPQKPFLGSLFFISSSFFVSIFFFSSTPILNFILYLLLAYFLSLLKILFSKNSFISFLLILEFIVITSLMLLVLNSSMSGESSNFVFFFLVLSVCFSCLGLGLLVEMVQLGVKEMELMQMKV